MEELQALKVYSRYTTLIDGALYVMMVGMKYLVELLVNSWDFEDIFPIHLSELLRIISGLMTSDVMEMKHL